MNQSRGKSNKNSGGNATSKKDDAKYEYDGHPLGYATFKDALSSFMFTGIPRKRMR